jgi:hypothetical protein
MTSVGLGSPHPFKKGSDNNMIAINTKKSFFMELPPSDSQIGALPIVNFFKPLSPPQQDFAQNYLKDGFLNGIN